MAKILFQAMNPKLFRAIFIGYLFEIAQSNRVVLLVGDIDEDTKRVLHDKSMFPGLEQIIFFESAFGGDIFGKNYRLCKTLKNAVQDFKPDIVITHSDIWPPDMYLLRFAKRAGAITIAMQAGFKIAGERKLYRWSCLMNACLKMPHFLPFPVRVFFAKAKKYAGHFLYYWILPLTADEMPFPGKTSFVFWDEASGLRDADYATVFSERDRKLYIRDGVPREKVFVIGHPLEHEGTKNFFGKVYGLKQRETFNQGGEYAQTLTIMWPDEKIGFRAKDYSLIPQEEMEAKRIQIVQHITEKLPDWNILVKPHPAEGDASKIKASLSVISPNISVVDPAEPADTYIARSACVIGMPPPSTTLFSALKQDPSKIILSLNLNGEFLGDSYKNFDSIEYIDSEARLLDVLSAIHGHSYQRPSGPHTPSDFSDAQELLNRIAAHV